MRSGPRRCKQPVSLAALFFFTWSALGSVRTNRFSQGRWGWACANPLYSPTHFQLHSDSLPGVRSVMEGMDSLEVLFKAASDTANRTRQTKSSITKVLRGKLMGRAGLKSTLIARKAAAQMYLPAPTDCTRTTMAPAQTRAASTVR